MRRASFVRDNSCFNMQCFAGFEPVYVVDTLEVLIIQIFLDQEI